MYRQISLHEKNSRILRENDRAREPVIPERVAGFSDGIRYRIRS